MSAITNRIKRALNHGGPSMGYISGLKNLGTILQNLTNGFKKHTHICYTLKAAVSDGGCARITLDGKYDSVSGILVLSDTGTPRAITKVEITEDAEEGTFALEVTATSVSAGDTIHADLYLMA